jgi:hypothetical protein
MNFTQYLAPHGRRQTISIDMSREVETKAAELVTAGWDFEIEVLVNLGGMVNMDCCDDDEQLAVEVCPNGPEVPAAVEQLVNRAHERWVARERPRGNGIQWRGTTESGSVV